MFIAINVVIILSEKMLIVDSLNKFIYLVVLGGIFKKTKKHHIMTMTSEK